MTQEQMEKAIQFILDQQSKNEVAISNLTATVKQMADEMRTGFDLLIASMVKTDKLVEQVTMLNMHTSKRVSAIERKLKNGKKSK
jgi:hypothetical protein